MDNNRSARAMKRPIPPSGANECTRKKHQGERHQNLETAAEPRPSAVPYPNAVSYPNAVPYSIADLPAADSVDGNFSQLHKAESMYLQLQTLYQSIDAFDVPDGDIESLNALRNFKSNIKYDFSFGKQFKNVTSGSTSQKDWDQIGGWDGIVKRLLEVVEEISNPEQAPLPIIPNSSVYVVDCSQEASDTKPIPPFLKASFGSYPEFTQNELRRKNFYAVSNPAFKREMHVQLLQTKNLHAFSVDFSPNGRLYALGCNGNAYVFNADSGNQVAKISSTGVISSISFSPDGKYLAMGGDSVKVWEFSDNELDSKSKFIWKMPYSDSNIKHNFSVAFIDGNRLVYGSSNNTITVRRLTLGIENSWPTVTGVNHVAVSTGKKYIAAGLMDGTVRVYKVNASYRECACFGDANGIPVYNVRFTNGDKHVLSCSGSTSKVWDLENYGNTQASQCKVAFVGHKTPTLSVCATQNSGLIVSCCESGEIILFHQKSGNVQLQLKGHDSRVRAIAVSPDSMANEVYFVSASMDGTTKLWRIMRFPKPVPWFDICNERLIMKTATHMVDGIDNSENPNNRRAEWSGNISTEYVLSKILQILYPGSSKSSLSQRCSYLLCNRQLAIISRMYGLPFDVNPEQEHVKFISETEKPHSDLVRAHFGYAYKLHYPYEYRLFEIFLKLFFPKIVQMEGNSEWKFVYKEAISSLEEHLSGRVRFEVVGRGDGYWCPHIVHCLVDNRVEAVVKACSEEDAKLKAADMVLKQRGLPILKGKRHVQG
ncbi:hypothetical protein DIURU_000172 [Diutina rugosa]|uniref:RNase III domain-containing protein n=1 Tax=Diutina rugosa TaxID=5481 RepID=A0A642V5M6_DIURU|nr:uncharacterized protein DIURU_000172 [Diutina rugosa]KAA8908383.1 hypothetical protein DIURU_000172 [Diutina rugosa]